MAIMTSVLYFPINNTQTWKFKIQCPGPFTLDYVVPQNIPPTGPRWYSGLTAPPRPFWKFQFSFYFRLKILAFEIPTPVGNSSDHLVGYKRKMGCHPQNKTTPEGVYAGCAGVCKDYFERSWTVVKYNVHGLVQ